MSAIQFKHDDIFKRISKSMSSGNLTLDEHSWEIVKSQALQKARAVQENVLRVAGSKSLSNLKLSPGLRSRNPSKDSLSDRLQSTPSPPSTSVDASPILVGFARMLVCLYFLNLVYDDYTAWSFLQSPDMQERIRLHPSRFPAAVFPYFKVCVVLPSALLATTGLPIRWVGLVLPLQILYSYGPQMLQQITNAVHGEAPMDELVVKKLAVAGAVFLLLACQTRVARRMNSYAGLMVLEDPQAISRRKSAVLLAGRLLMSTLFIFAGCSQVRRVVERDMQLWRRHTWGAQDGHDNNWLLLELLLTLPFMLGYKMELVSRSLSATMALEALTCWAFWMHSYPTWHIASHVRSHFFTNTAVAGGLLLLQSHGAGCFTLDALLVKKKES